MDAQPVQISNGTTLYLRFNASGTQNITFDVTSGAPSTPSFATIYASYGDQSGCQFKLYGPQTEAQGNDFFGAFSATFLGGYPSDSPSVFTLVVNATKPSDPNLDAVSVSAFAAPIESLVLDVSSSPFTFEPPLVFVTQQLNLSTSSDPSLQLPGYLSVFLYNPQAGDDYYEAPAAPTLRIGYGQVFEDDCIDENRTLCVSTTNVFPTPAAGLYFVLDALTTTTTISMYATAGFSFYDDLSQIPTSYYGQLLATLQTPLQLNISLLQNSAEWITDSIPFRGIRSYALNFSSIAVPTLPFYAAVTLQHRGAVLYVGSGYLPSETDSDNSMTQQNYIEVESIQPDPYPYFINSTELIAISTPSDLNNIYYLLVNSFVYGDSWNDSSLYYKLNIQAMRPWFIFLGSCNIAFLSGGTAKSYAIDLSNSNFVGTSVSMHVESGKNGATISTSSYVKPLQLNDIVYLQKET